MLCQNVFRRLTLAKNERKLLSMVGDVSTKNKMFKVEQKHYNLAYPIIAILLESFIVIGNGNGGNIKWFP